jgi:ribose 5-phosphate isomerase B
MKIAISTDHAGFELLRQLEAFLVEQGHTCVDYGPKEFNPLDDYPDFIFPAAKAVASGECEMGVILGGSGQGEAMAANRIKGVRCAVYYGGVHAAPVSGLEGEGGFGGQDIVRLSREHNDANMLSLGARFLSVDEAQQAVSSWLTTRFSSNERHKRRIEKLDQVEG